MAVAKGAGFGYLSLARCAHINHPVLGGQIHEGRYAVWGDTEAESAVNGVLKILVQNNSFSSISTFHRIVGSLTKLG
jgi:hypothetical protein